MAFLHYQPLAEGEIRVLTIDTTSLRSPEIHINMSAAKLNQTTEYIALSYVWGSETDRRDIKLNGRSMSVTANLYDALICMRKNIAMASLGFPAKIWVDAISINQNDIDERNKQVARMRDIYTQALMVWAFVGIEMEHDQDGFNLMKALALKFQELSQALELGHKLPEEASQTIANSLQHPGLEVAWKAIGRLLTRPWWTRAWIVQEIALARSAIFSCGEQAIGMSDVLLVGELLWAYMTQAIAQSDERAAERITVVDRFEGLDVGSRDASLLLLQNRIQRLDRKLQGMDRQTLAQFAQDLGVKDAQKRAASWTWTEVADLSLLATWKIPGHTLTNVLARFKSRQCGNPLDKIYALHGLARPFMEPSLLPVDYGLQAPVLWRRVVRAHLELYGNLDILYLFSGSPTPNGFSSWAHECTARWATHPDNVEVKSGGVEFMASLGRSPQVGHQASGCHAGEGNEKEKESWVDKSFYLCLNGIAVDTVKTVGQAFDPNDPSHIDAIRTKIEWQESLQDLSEAHFHGFDGPALEQWKELAGVKEPFNQVKETAFSLYRDQDNDVVVGSKSDRNDLIAGTWSSMTSGEMLKEYPTGQTNLDAFIQSLMMDTVPCQEYAPLFHQRLATLKGHGRGDPFEPMFFSSSLLGFHFYVTDKGYYGLVPCDVQVGDQVCVLYGSKMPFLLRNIGDTKYALLSWTFVLGLMNGEALAEANIGHLSEKTFCLV
ncbi:hypothetical protein EG329_007362 [Mollisiaceae sp. DMI_Dod_QoI]|nr:hypothetical protein EG329_007362 [Helotiales sp. DMI_Dod_QoI]